MAMHCTTNDLGNDLGNDLSGAVATLKLLT
jgi:hypothetical protein